VQWQYDALGRRIRETTWTWNANSGTWEATEDLKFVSEATLFGRRIAELNASDSTLVRTYVWGLDLSGTEQGAGGVGGLLWLTQHAGPNTGTHFAAYDGNGNIVALSAASDGSETARYEYGPFGELIRVSGPFANQNPFRFSTKSTCNTTDLVLYEYRAYSPALGRWLIRDPIMESCV
jgi:RHS repeat-associated protein